MKKLIFCFLLFLIFQVARAQEKIKEPADSLTLGKSAASTSNLSATQTANLSKQSPNSPTAAGLGNYVDFPVSFNTGLPQINIPITLVQGKSLSLPVSLSYHSGGVKVADVASWVGLNWSLNAGGVITRQIFGGPDESYTGGNKGDVTLFNPGVLYNTPVNSGWYEKGGYDPIPPLDETDTDFENRRVTFRHLISASIGLKDMEPDIFSYNIGGKTGKFYFDEQRVAQFLPKQDIRVEVQFNFGTKQFDTFIMTDSDGTRYYFGGTSFEASTSSLGNGTLFGTKLKSAWYLYKMESANRLDTIDLEYDSEGTEFYNVSAEQALLTNARYTNISQAFVTRNIIYGQRLRKILSNKMEVNFNANTQRQDVAHYNSGTLNLGTPNRLDNITIFNKQTQQNVLKYKMGYSYTQSTDNTPAFDTDFDQKRLILNSIQEFSADETESKPKTELEYETLLLPRRLSYARDHGGYYNGKSNNNTLIDIDNSFIAPDRFHDRAVNENYAKAGRLIKITWPTGGNTQYEFEGIAPNPGQRIKKIAAFDGTVQLYAKTYTYDNATNPFSFNNYTAKAYNWGITGSPQGNIAAASQKTNDWMDFTINGFWNANITVPPSNNPVGYPLVLDVSSCGAESSIPVNIAPTENIVNSDLYQEIKSLVGQSVMYSTIIETQADGGYSEYRYPNISPYFFNYNYAFPLIASMDKVYNLMNKGKLTYEAHYKANNAKQAETFFDYQSLDAPETQKAYKIVPMFCNPERISVSKYFLPKGTRSLLLKKTEKIYDENGTNAIEKVTTFEYGTHHEKPIITATNRNNGDSLIVKQSYVFDLASSSYAIGHVLDKMKDLNMNLPVESITYLKKPTETRTTMKATGAKYIEYDKFASNIYLFRPKNIAILKVGGETTSITEAFFNNSQLNIDDNYITKIYYNYNSQGFLESEKIPFGAETKYTYNTYGLLNSETNAFGTNEAKTTSYEYDLLFGITKITAPNLITNTYYYDKLGRLTYTKDHLGNVEGKNVYDYANKRMGAFSSRTEITDVNNVSLANANLSYSYFDGLGRAKQTVAQQASPSGKDIIVGAAEYDPTGRPFKSYLPYPATKTDGLQDNNPQQGTDTFYGDSKAYSLVTYEASPLNQAKTETGPGEVWHNDQKKYSVTNSVVGTAFAKYMVNGNGASFTENYPANTLYQTETTDEQGNKTASVADMEGNTLFETKQLTANETATTSYVYDAQNRLCYTLMPEAFGTNEFTETSDVFKNHIFAYKYDEQSRPSAKHVPGAGWSYFVYDRANQLVLSQTATETAAGKYSFYKYDALGRVIQMGMMANANNASAAQTAFNTFTSNAFETRNSAETHGYSQESFPLDYKPAEADYKQINFYDSYNFGGADFDTNGTPHAQANANGMETGSKTKDLTTGTWYTNTQYYDYLGRLIQEHIGNQIGTDVANMTYRYDGALTHTDYTHAGIKASNNITLDPQGRPTALSHAINGNSKTLATYQYDELGRLIQKTISPQTATYGASDVNSLKSGTWADGTVWSSGNEPCATDRITINPNHNINVPTQNNVYTGPLTVKGNLKIEPQAYLYLNENQPNALNLTALQKVNYNYNVRGWLTGINSNAASSEADLFSNTFTYNYDGSIATNTWASPTNKCNGALQTRSYAYTYDQANRLSSATYTGQGDYSLPEIDYTKNGNINRLQRKGQLSNGGFGLIDHLTYDYQGNQLQSIADAVAGSHGVDFVKGNGNYQYDTEGALTNDPNEKTQITYNDYLRQPTSINANGQTLSYQYTAEGTLLKATDKAGDVWEYFGPMTYKNGLLHEIATPEGRALYHGGQYVYEYDHADPQGNKRVSYTGQNGQLKITSVQDFDPFGVLHAGNSYANGLADRNTYQGNTKETGLNRINFGFRSLNPTTGLFDRVDVLAEVYNDFSPYHFAGNNPVNIVDVLGLGWDSSKSSWNTQRGHGVDGGNEAETANNSFMDQAEKFSYFMSQINRYFNDGTSSGGRVPGADYNDPQPPKRKNFGLTTANIKSNREPATISAYKPDIYDRWRDGNIGQKFVYGMADGIYSYVTLSQNHLGGRNFTNYDDKINTKLGGFMTLFGGVLGSAKKAGNIAITTSDGFLFKGFTIKTPFNIPVQRFGNMSLGKPDFWGLRIGTNKFLNRTFAAIKPSWNPLTQYTKGIIPKGTKVKVGAIGPQGLKYPGGSLQFILDSKNVLKQNSLFKF